MTGFSSHRSAAAYENLVELLFIRMRMSDDAILEESSLQQLSQLDQDKILTCVKTP